MSTHLPTAAGALAAAATSLCTRTMAFMNATLETAPPGTVHQRDDVWDALKRTREAITEVRRAMILDEHAPDAVEAEHGIDPAWRENTATPAPHTFTFPTVHLPDGWSARPRPSATGDGTPIPVEIRHTPADALTVTPEQALALVAGALTLGRDLVKRGHPRNAQRYLDAATALATDLGNVPGYATIKEPTP